MKGREGAETKEAVKLKTWKKKFSKVSFRNKNLWKSYGSLVAVISSIVTLVSFCMPPSGGWKWRMGCSFLFLLFLAGLFVYQWYQANQADCAELKINGTNVNVRIGDIFEQNGLKVIGVNNYMDLEADDVVVSKATLHGKFLMRHQDEIGGIREAVADSKTLIAEKDCANSGRPSYDYGSCVLYQDYVLTVLTKFNEKNMAYTDIGEYIRFWMVFWENMDTLYNSRTINIPILGAGQTRFRGVKPKKQELLEIALWTLKESGFCNHYADASINFWVYEGDAAEIDFYRVRRMGED